MGTHIRLEAADGHSLSAWLAEPEGPPKAGLIILQEVFGVNSHIRAVADGYAREGFKAIAPALFDRIQRGFEVGYDADSLQRGLALARSLSRDTVLADIAAALQALGLPRVGVVGYCMGGALAWTTAVTQPVQAAVVYYGRPEMMLDQEPGCPVLGHFGTRDASIPVDRVKEFASRHPKATFHLYEAGHGFNCDQRASYDPPSARLALERTLAFLRQHLTP